MKKKIDKIKNPLHGIINLSASKSESNRCLIIQKLSKEPITLHHLSPARDTETLRKILTEDPLVWDVMDAGTAMRFLTAYAAVCSKEKVLTGSKRMKNRPIKPLVDALVQLGAKINYVDKEGFPPLKIVRSIVYQMQKTIAIDTDVSSQFMSALLLIAPTLPSGLMLIFESKPVSYPYILMTLSLLKNFGIDTKVTESSILVNKGCYRAGEYIIESDWSNAGYWYSFLALSPFATSGIYLKGLKENSYQGDAKIAEIMKNYYGVETTYRKDGIFISKSAKNSTQKINLDLKDFPDLAQTLMVTSALKKIPTTFKGLHSLKIKETDRISAMQKELRKLNAKLIEYADYWEVIPSNSIPDKTSVQTYEDHRMAMAFAPAATLMDVIFDEDTVVQKSYPDFWTDLDRIS